MPRQPWVTLVQAQRRVLAPAGAGRHVPGAAGARRWGACPAHAAALAVGEQGAPVAPRCARPSSGGRPRLGDPRRIHRPAHAAREDEPQVVRDALPLASTSTPSSASGASASPAKLLRRRLRGHEGERQHGHVGLGRGSAAASSCRGPACLRGRMHRARPASPRRRQHALGQRRAHLVRRSAVRRASGRSRRSHAPPRRAAAASSTGARAPRCGPIYGEDGLAAGRTRHRSRAPGVA